MNKIKLVLFLNLISFLLSGCQKSDNGGTTTGNPVTVNMKITASSQVASPAIVKHFHILPNLFINKVFALAPPALQDSTGRTVTLSDYWMALKTIEIRSTQTSGGGETADVKYVGPYAINMLASNPPFFGAILITPPILRFKAIFQKLDFAAPGAPVGMTNYAVYFAGQVNGLSFIVRSDEGITYEVSGPNPVSPPDNGVLLLSVKTANLFKRINLAAVTNGINIDPTNRVPAANPCPTINASATDLYTCFKDGLHTQANFGHDRDENDELDNTDSTVK